MCWISQTGKIFYIIILFFGGAGLYKTNAHHPEAQWQCCVWCDIPAGCNGNCSSAQHPAVSSLTVRRTVTSISCIWVWASQQVFLYCTRSPYKRNIPWKGPGSLSWALSLWWGSGHSGCFKYPLWAVGHKDKWQHSVWLTENDRKRECRDATLLFYSNESLGWLCMAQNQGHH